MLLTQADASIEEWGSLERLRVHCFLRDRWDTISDTVHEIKT